MAQLKELVEVDKRFQNSVNLQLDLGNDKKLNSYIPTRSSVLILGQYLKQVRDNKDKATILIGPYGKGKSHLLLVLLAILSYQKKERKRLEPMVGRIRKIDPEVGDVATSLIFNEKQYLPVIINSSGKDLNQDFLLGLLDALKKYDLEDIAPDSYYSQAVKMIEKWEKEFPDTFHNFEKQIKALGQGAAEFKNKLQRMNETALAQFKKIYPSLTAGAVFQPVVQTDSLKLYQEINKALCEKHGFAGIYIIFDEFSKYIEGHEDATFARDMKIIQDMCELASSSKEFPIHITFVAHKSIKEYGHQLSKEKINAFTGVEGRLKEVLFIVSSQNNYELIQSAIHKKSPEYKKEVEEKNYADIVTESYKMTCFASLFSSEKDYKNIIGYGCFPLLPLTAYMLLNISEKVAQNERSIFTFLANEEKGSLERMIATRSAADGCMVTADVIYDYFQNLFRENTAMTAVHSEWLKAEYALGKATTLEEKKVIKTMALILMLRKPEEISVNEKSICMALGISRGKYSEIIENLKEKQIILWRSKTATFAFKNNVGVDLEKEIKNVISKQKSSLDICGQLGRISELEYILPKQHNQEYTMTRYFHYMYLTVEQFLKLKKAEYLFEEKEADGKIVALVWEQEADKKLIEEHAKELADERIVCILSDKAFSETENIRRLLAVETLLGNEEFLENNKVLKQELELYKEDLIFEINVALEQSYLPEYGKCSVFAKDSVLHGEKQGMEFNRILSSICTEYYAQAPKINNEMINRQIVTAQTKKARNEIVKSILEELDAKAYGTGTSPQATIYRATMLHTGIVGTEAEIEAGCEKILEQIQLFIKKASGKKSSFEKLYHILTGKNYGVRKGVIPIFLARQFSLLEDTPVIYLLDKEVGLNSEILDNINEKPEEYYLFVEKKSVEKEKYLQDLTELFVPKSGQDKAETKGMRLTNIVAGMHRWYRSLPQYTLNFKERPAGMSEETFDEVQQFRNIFRKMELNPREVLFERIPEIFGVEKGFEAYSKDISEIYQYLNDHLLNMQKEAIKRVKKEFAASKKESLGSCLKDWYTNQSDTAKKHLISDKVSNFMGYVGNIATYDEVEMIERLAKIMVDLYMEDWNDQTLDLFTDEIHNAKVSIEGIQNGEEPENGQNYILFKDQNGEQIEKFFDSSEEDDSTSYFLKNAIEEAMDEFGDTLEVNQKVSVLMKALEKLIHEGL